MSGGDDSDADREAVDGTRGGAAFPTPTLGQWVRQWSRYLGLDTGPDPTADTTSIREPPAGVCPPDEETDRVDRTGRSG